MSAFSQTLQSLTGFFHALSKTLTEGTQNPFEAYYKSAHSLRALDVWADVVAYAVDQAAADTEAATNPAVTKYTQVDLTPIPGSNNQAWYYDLAGTFVRPWIAETDVPDPVTSAPSFGYQPLLYQQDFTPITPTEGRWNISAYSGTILFEAGYTPIDQGYALPIKATFYVYTGSFVSAGIGAEILYGEGPPHNIVNTANPQIYVDTRDYTGNPLQYVLWAWVNRTNRYSGWRPCTFKWSALYEIDNNPATEWEYYDFIKGNPETAPIIEVIDKGIYRPTYSTAKAVEIIDAGARANKINTAKISEDIIITLINTPTSEVNNFEINSCCLNG